MQAADTNLVSSVKSNQTQIQIFHDLKSNCSSRLPSLSDSCFLGDAQPEHQEQPVQGPFLKVALHLKIKGAASHDLKTKDLN